MNVEHQRYRKYENNDKPIIIIIILLFNLIGNFRIGQGNGRAYFMEQEYHWKWISMDKSH